MNEPTPQQKRAIEARGNVLVAAGAGAGKTRTLVDRCVAWIVSEAERGSVDEILMVTFTEAAATEMRQRLRQGLEAAHATAPSPRLLEQLALLETAHISTLHGFCFYLISQHFSELGLDGPPSVLSGERAGLFSCEALDATLDKVYDGKIPGATAIQEFIKAHGGDWDKPAREMVRRAHEYRHSLRDPQDWLMKQRNRFSRTDASEWRAWLMEGLEDWRNSWTATLQRRAPENFIAEQCLKILAGLPAHAERKDFAPAFEAIGKIEKPRGSGPLRKAIKAFFSDAAFLHSVTAVGDEDPLDEDWNWARPSMLALLDLTEAYDDAYTRNKRTAGGLDFQDLEQFALRLLWEKGRPTTIAEQWRKKIQLIFVDEFQDFNGAQEAIIEALSREGAAANCFLVGDVKQSIYRFRLTDPRIFKRRQEQWRKSHEGVALALTENFRSHEGIIDFVNALFVTLMRPEIGGVLYDKNSHLVFGDRQNRSTLTVSKTSDPRVELHLRHPSSDGDEDNAGVEREAQLIGQRLRELKDADAIVNTREGPRPVAWRDMALLLRAPRGKAEAYMKAFTRLGIPLVAARGGFYDTMEARDLLNLLRILDNPLQDLPLLGVLASSFAGLTPRDLALVRIGREKGRFWSALTAWRTDARDKTNDLYRKVDIFLERFHAWRRMARQSGVASTLERALDQTHYTSWLSTQDRSAQRRTNVERFLQLARDSDAERGEGVARFLKMIEAQQDNEIDLEPAALPATDTVRLMSIHQSKGLEFPVVALGDLGKPFNLQDLTRGVILDEELGLCPQIKPPGAAQFYPSIAFWLAQRRQEREAIGEELRLLYVAVTRAMEWLILVGTVSEKRVAERWPQLAQELSTDEGILHPRNYLDWLGGWMTAQKNSSESAALRLVIHRDDDTPPVKALPEKEMAVAEDISPEVRTRMDWAYPFIAATEQPTKTSVTGLQRQLTLQDDEEAAPWFVPRAKGLGGAARGSAHHIFLEAASFQTFQTRHGLAEEAGRLCREGRLDAAQTASLNLDAVFAFWESEAGQRFLKHSESVRRELAFTARFSVGELAERGLGGVAGAEEFVVVQGAVDLAAILPEEIWIVDFKTDEFAEGDLSAKTEYYRPQLSLYGMALARIYNRPVTNSWLCFLSQRKVVLL